MHNSVIHSSDIKPLDFTISHTNLELDLTNQIGLAQSQLTIERLNPTAQSLILNGFELGLESISLNGQVLTSEQYQLVPNPHVYGEQALVLDLHQLELTNSKKFTLQISNTFLLVDKALIQGLYHIGEGIYSNCNFEGFRAITFFIDRPDCRSIFEVKITASTQFSHIISVGNLVNCDNIDDQSQQAHYITPKPISPSQFGLVIGNFDHQTIEYSYPNQRKILFRIAYAEGQENEASIDYSFQCLNHIATWAYNKLGYELELDCYTIVATPYERLFAIESYGFTCNFEDLFFVNKDKSMDITFISADGTIAQNFFLHLITSHTNCSNWFNQALTIGLAYYLQQEYLADNYDPLLCRLFDIQTIKSAQFPLEQSPLVSAVCPRATDNYYALNTPTLLYKTPELYRMLALNCGHKQFFEIIKAYLNTFSTATVKDFLAFVTTQSGLNLEHFYRWFTQTGTPKVTIFPKYDDKKQICTITFKQHNPQTLDNQFKQVLPIYLDTEFLSPQGKILENLTTLEGTPIPKVITLDSAHYQLKFKTEQEPIIVTNKNFSSPIELDIEYTLDELCTIAKYATDRIVRCKAYLQAYRHVYEYNLYRLQNVDPIEIPLQVLDLFAYTIDKAHSDLSFAYQNLNCLQALYPFVEVDHPINPIHEIEIFEQVQTELYKLFEKPVLNLYNSLSHTAYKLSAEQITIRLLKALLLNFLTFTQEHKDLVLEQFKNIDNLDDLVNLIEVNCNNKLGLQQIEDHFITKYKQNSSILEQYLVCKARRVQSIAELEQLLNLEVDESFEAEKRFIILSNLKLNPKFIYSNDEVYHLINQNILQLDEIDPNLSSTLAQTIYLDFYQYAQPWSELLVTNIKQLSLSLGVSDELAQVINAAMQTVLSLGL